MQRHGDVKPYLCDECPKRFYTTFELKRHRPVHSDYRQFCCFLCDAQFKRKCEVKRSVLQYTVSAPFCYDYEQCVWSTTDDIS